MRYVVSVGDRECVNLDFPKFCTYTYIHIDIYIAPLHAQGTSMPRAHKIYSSSGRQRNIPSLLCKNVYNRCHMHIHLFYTFYILIAVKGCSFVEGRMRNCIFCPLSLSVMFIVLIPACMYIVECNLKDF